MHEPRCLPLLLVLLLLPLGGWECSPPVSGPASPAGAATGEPDVAAATPGALPESGSASVPAAALPAPTAAMDAPPATRGEDADQSRSAVASGPPAAPASGSAAAGAAGAATPADATGQVTGRVIAAMEQLVTTRPGTPPPLLAPEDVTEPPADAPRTPTGLASKVLRPGSGRHHPRLEDRVRVHYTGWTARGRMLDSSVARGEPASFPLRAVIAGWSEGLQLMVVGEKRRLWLPAELAYRGRPGKPLPAAAAGDGKRQQRLPWMPGTAAVPGMLVFDMELLEILHAPEAPPDVTGPPSQARRTPSGLAFRVLQKSKGTRRPGPTSRVRVEYTGWTAEGRMFDSTETRGEPTTFPLDRMITGLAEGLQLMVEGEKRRLWIPAELAYKDWPGVPMPGAGASGSGMLVFDVKLLAILD